MVELVTDYLEGVLRPAVDRRFRHHLAGCPGCAAYLAQIRATVDLLARLRLAS